MIKQARIGGLSRSRARRERISGTVGRSAARLIRRPLGPPDSFRSLCPRSPDAGRRPTGPGRLPPQAQAHVPAPPVPGARLAMVETEIVLGALEALLNRPAQPRRAGQFAQRDTNRRKGKRGGPFVGLPPTAPDQQRAGHLRLGYE